MQWLWRSTDADLGNWEHRPYSTGVELGPRLNDKRDTHERVIGTESIGPPVANGIARRLADAILRFDVFPPRLLTSVLRRRPVAVGDVLGLRYPFLLGLDLLFASRVIDCFETQDDREWRCGFSYRTLKGHPACGEETFVVEKDLATGTVTAALRSWSRPGLLIARLAYPVMRMFQLRAARAALDHLQEIAGDGENREGEAPAEPAQALLRGSAGASPSRLRRDQRTGFLRSDRL